MRGASPFLRVCAGGLPAGTKRKAGEKWRFLWKRADPWVLAVFVFKIERWRQRQVERHGRGERYTETQLGVEAVGGLTQPPPPPPTGEGRERAGVGERVGGREAARRFPQLRSAPHPEKGLAWCPQPS